MKTQTSTKRALVFQLLSMLVCVSMLVGSTFAWFTDTASTAVNTIQAGNLDVQLLDADGNELGAAPLKWVAKDGRAQSEIFWEPGATYNLESFRIKNNGNLSLKYQVVISGIQGNAKLLEVIDFTYTVADEAGTVTAYDIAGEHPLAAGKDSGLITISGHMQETAGNEYMNEKIEGIAIAVYARQDTGESDSDGNGYDADAKYPVSAVTSVELDADGKIKEELIFHAGTKVAGTTTPAATVTLPAGAKMNAGTTKATLVIRETDTPKNFTVELTQTAPKTLDISLEGVATDNTGLIKVEFYIGTGLSLVEIYHSGTRMSRCSGLQWVDEDQEFYYNAATGFVTMLTSSFSPFTYTSDKFYWGRNGNMASDYATPVDTEQKTVTISTPAEMALFASQVTNQKVSYAGYTVNITADIDLGDGYWTPISAGARLAGITINGNGHTIRNMLVRGCTNSSGYGFAFIGDMRGAITIRNLAFDNANVKAIKYGSYWGNVGGIVMGYTYGTTVFENVSVTNSCIEGYGKIGILLGMGADPGVSVTFRNCVSKDNTIYGTYNLGGLAGNIQRKAGIDYTVVENCTVENIAVIHASNDVYQNFVNMTATFQSDDSTSGTDVVKTITGEYWLYNGYYWGGYADYYVSYGGSSVDPVITAGGSGNIANSEITVNKQ